MRSGTKQGAKIAPKGCVVRKQLVTHTAQSAEDVATLCKRWGERKAVLVVRRALRLAVEQSEAKK